MEQENKYYTPDVSELHVGYECEACFSSYGGYTIIDCSEPDKPWEHHPPVDKEAAKHWTKFKLIEREDIWTSNGRDHSTAVMCLNDKRLRTQYLSREQIEAEGWDTVKELPRWTEKQPIIYGSGYKNAMMAIDFENHLIWVGPKDPTKSMDGTQDEYDYPPNKGMFRGECKSINEFRKIIKLLGIK